MYSFTDFFGSASFVVMDTDYENYALICTCQSKKILFDALTFHRRSCTILQRSPERDTTIVDEVVSLRQNLCIFDKYYFAMEKNCLTKEFNFFQIVDERFAEFTS